MTTAVPSPLLDQIRKLASREYQARAWFALGPEVSSLEEMYCMSVDDLQIETYRDAVPAIGALIHALVYASPRLPLDDNGFCVPAVIIDHPAWLAVRQVAATFLASTTER